MATIVEQSKEFRKLWGGFQASRVLMTANNFRVFDHLKSPRTAYEIAGILNTSARATARLLDALTGLGLLKKSAGRYKNTPTAGRFLVASSRYYQGNIIRHADNLWKNWSGLDEVIKTGKPYHAAHDQDSFIRGMDNLAALKAKEVIGAIGLKGVRKALDLGGGPGTYAMEIARKGIDVTLFDRPETIQIAGDVIKKAGGKNIKFLRGDIFQNDFGRGYDLILISHVLHSCSETEAFRAIQKSKWALNPGGRVVVQEFYIREDLAGPSPGALFAINMLVNTPDGRCYSPSEIKKWFSDAGLKKIRVKMMEDTVLVEGERS